MNKVILMGRLTKDVDLRYTTGEAQTAVGRFTLAIDRKGKKPEGQQAADFPSIVAFGKTAEFVEKYFKKGDKIAIIGRIQTGSYTNKDGAKVYTTEVIADEAEFVENKKTAEAAPAVDENGFMNIPDGIDADLPFN